MSRFITPEQAGAIGDGVADDTKALASAVASGLNIEARHGAIYRVSGPIGTLSDGQALDLKGAEIRAAWEQSGSEYDAVIRMHGSSDASVVNGKITWHGAFDLGGSYAGFISAIWGNDCERPTVRNMELSGFNRSGVLFGAITSGGSVGAVFSPTCIDVYAHHNRVSGISFGQTVDGVVSSCSLISNGLGSDVHTGYGFAGLYPYNPARTRIINNTANNNVRKGIDFHRGTSGIISGNTVHGNGLFGIFVDAVRGSWSISTNIVSGMLADGSHPFAVYGIKIGSHTGLGTSGEATNFVCTGNVISDFKKSGSGVAYPLFLVGVGLTSGGFTVTGNTIAAGDVTAIVGGENSVAGGVAGAWHDILLSNNSFTVGAVAEPPIKFFGSNSRKKVFSGNMVVIASAGSATGVMSYTPSAVPGASLLCNGNDIVAPSSAWSSVHDPIAVQRLSNEVTEGNNINNTRWRDWDGARYVGRGPGNYPSTGSWTAGSRWERTDGIVSGSTAISQCVSAGTPGIWSLFVVLP